MSFDLFVGNPDTRIVRTRDLLAYFNTDTDWENDPEAYRGPIDPRIAEFANALAIGWPPLNPAGPLRTIAAVDDDRATGYSFRPTSLYLDFRWSRSSEAHETVRELALRHNLLFFNCSGRDWANGIAKPERGKPGRIYLGDRENDGSRTIEWSGETSWIEPGDADLLTETDWFGPNCYFGFEFGDEHYMQSINKGETYIIEYRKGSPDRHFRAETTSIEEIRRSFNLYYEGDERAFSVLTYENVRV